MSSNEGGANGGGANDGGDVIDWDGAMEQCGDDEEFLRELLADLRGEIDAQLDKIEESLESNEDAPYHRIQRASHVIKGAASNLMCQQLRVAATNLETVSANANALKEIPDETKSDVEAKYKELKKASEEYNKYLKSIDV